MFDLLRKLCSAINSAFHACAERVRAHVASCFVRKQNEEIEAVACFKAAARLTQEKKEIVLRELRERLKLLSIDDQVETQDGIVLNEAAVKVLGTDLAFIESDRMQRCLSEAWMQEIVEMATTVSIESLGVLTLFAEVEEHVNGTDEGMDGGNLDFLMKYCKDYVVEESEDLEDDCVYIIDADSVKLFGLDLINLYDDYMHDVEELLDEAHDVLYKYYQVE